jgi:Asp-tRNA(Asn)/Glu-tRNA(Gln) amidotransferase A subunit family amidase
VSIARGDHYGVLHELCFEPARKLIAMLLAGEVSSTELTRGLYERISKVNPKLNAVVTLREENAHQKSWSHKGFHGSANELRLSA